MTTLQEYDLEIKRTKIVHGQGLHKLVVEAEDRKYETKEEQLDLEKEFWKEYRWENGDEMYEREDFKFPP